MEPLLLGVIIGLCVCYLYIFHKYGDDWYRNDIDYDDEE